jgi:hypothetical protein
MDKGFENIWDRIEFGIKLTKNIDIAIKQM